MIFGGSGAGGATPTVAAEVVVDGLTAGSGWLFVLKKRAAPAAIATPPMASASLGERVARTLSGSAEPASVLPLPLGLAPFSPLSESRGQAVRQHATRLQTEHAMGLEREMKLSQQIGVTPVKGPLAQSLESTGAEILARLARLDGAAFDQAFLQQSIADHTRALTLIDETLVRVATNEHIKQELRTLRTHVMHHRDEAQRLAGAR